MAPKRDGRPHANAEPGAARDPMEARPVAPQLDARRLGSRLRKHPAVRVVVRLFPPAAGLAVAKALLDYLPQPLGPDAARYLVAVLGGLSTISTLSWLGRWLGNRPPTKDGDEADPPPLLFGICSPNRSVNDLLDASREALLDGMVAVGSADEELIGWQHFFHESGRLGERPTAIGTCYGLKSMLLIGAVDPRFRQRRVVETLWKLQVPTGGWSARTQSTIGRPEVTAWVLSALLQAGGDEDRVTAAVQRCGELLDPVADPVGWGRTLVVATTLSVLARSAPPAPLSVRLRDSLLSGMTFDPELGLRCWGERLLTGATEEQVVPSVPHTARAVMALRYADHTDRGNRAIDEAVRWLITRHDLANQTEHIRRGLPEFRKESIVVKHFTAAWVARVLMSVEEYRYEGSGELLSEAVALVCRLQRDGVWEWDNKERPIWMTYQGIATLRLRALRTSRLPR